VNVDDAFNQEDKKNIRGSTGVVIRDDKGNFMQLLMKLLILLLM
jgi:hypothetical protein